MTMDEIKAAKRNRVVGSKQVLKAINEGLAGKVFLADDADPALLQRLLQASQHKEVPVVRVTQMKDLGLWCGIEVGTAAAAILHEAGR